MGAAIGQILPFAVGVGLSPIPIIAVILMLVSKRASVNGPAFLGGWLVGLAAVGAAVLLLLGATSTGSTAEPKTWVDVLKLTVGALVLLVAVRQWKSRPREGRESPPPTWMSAVDDFSPLKAAGAGVVLAAANPKNLLLALGAATSIAQSGIPADQETVAYAVFMAVGTIGVAVPVVIYFAMGDRATPLLHGLKTWMGRNNAVIMAVLCLVIGVKLVGDALSGFSS